MLLKKLFAARQRRRLVGAAVILWIAAKVVVLVAAGNALPAGLILLAPAALLPWSVLGNFRNWIVNGLFPVLVSLFYLGLFLLPFGRVPYGLVIEHEAGLGWWGGDAMHFVGVATGLISTGLTFDVLFWCVIVCLSIGATDGVLERLVSRAIVRRERLAAGGAGLLILALGLVACDRRPTVPDPPDAITVAAAHTREEGRRIYAQRCGTCHGATGAGVPAMFPPIDQSRYLAGSREEIRKHILEGSAAIGDAQYKQQWAGVMPPTTGLADDQLEALIDYLKETFR